MSDSQPNDSWASGAAYEPYIGRWSRLTAGEFLKWLAVPEQSDWLDVGCGTGALSQAILSMCSPRAVKGIDRSEDFVRFARKQVSDGRARFEVGDATSITDPAGVYDATVSGLVLNFVPEPERMIMEMARVTKPGGDVAVYVWDYADQMQLIRYFWDAAAALDANAREQDEGRRFPICQPEPLAALFNAAGLQNVEVQTLDVATIFADFDDYWTPFLGAQGPAPSYVASLSDEQRLTLRQRLHSQLPTTPNGSIRLNARAWAARGIARG